MITSQRAYPRSAQHPPWLPHVILRKPWRELLHVDHLDHLVHLRDVDVAELEEEEEASLAVGTGSPSPNALDCRTDSSLRSLGDKARSGVCRIVGTSGRRSAAAAAVAAAAAAAAAAASMGQDSLCALRGANLDVGPSENRLPELLLLSPR